MKYTDLFSKKVKKKWNGRIYKFKMFMSQIFLKSYVN